MLWTTDTRGKESTQRKPEAQNMSEKKGASTKMSTISKTIPQGPRLRVQWQLRIPASGANLSSNRLSQPWTQRGPHIAAPTSIQKKGKTNK